MPSSYYVHTLLPLTCLQMGEYLALTSERQLFKLFVQPCKYNRCSQAGQHLHIMHTQHSCLGRYPEPFRDFADFLPAACNFSTIVFATFPEHHGHALEQLLSTACPSQQLVFVVHNPEELLQPGAAACLPGKISRAW